MRTALALVAFMLASAQAFAQQNGPTLTAADLTAADFEFQNENNAKLVVLKESLANSDLTLSDGTRGYEVIPRFEVGTTPFTGNYDQDSLIQLGREACSAQAIVVARADDASSFFVDGGKGIVTARWFYVDRVLSGDLNTGDKITVIRFGGRLTQNGVTMKVEVRGTSPFLKGTEYLLFLNKSPDHPSLAYFLLGYRQDRVTDGKIYPSSRAGDDIIRNPLSTGESIDAFAATLPKALSQFTTRAPNRKCQSSIR